MAYNSKWGNTLISDLMRDYGLSKGAAQGFAGVLAMESEGFSDWDEDAPVVKGSRGGGGMAMWTGVRRREFEAWAKKNGFEGDKLYSYASQYGYLKKELADGKHDGGILKRLKGIEDAQEAGRLTTKYFLRPGIVNQKVRKNWVDTVAGNYKPVPGRGLLDEETGASQIGKNGADPMAGISRIAQLVSGTAVGGLSLKANQFGVDPSAPNSLMSFAERAAAAPSNSVTRKVPVDPNKQPPIPAVKSKAVQAKQDSVLLAIDDIFKKGLQLDADSRSLGGYAGRAPAPSADLALAGVEKSGLKKPLVEGKQALPKPAPLTFAIDSPPKTQVKPATKTPAATPGVSALTFNDEKLQALVNATSGVVKYPGQAGKVAMPADARPSSLPAVKKSPLLDEMFPNPAATPKNPVSKEDRDAAAEQKLLKAKSNIKLDKPENIGIDPNNPVIKLGNIMLGAASAGAAVAQTTPVFGDVSQPPVMRAPTTGGAAGSGGSGGPMDARRTGTVQRDYGSKPGQSTAGLKPGDRQYNADTNTWDLKA